MKDFEALAPPRAQWPELAGVRTEAHPHTRICVLIFSTHIIFFFFKLFYFNFNNKTYLSCMVFDTK